MKVALLHYWLTSMRGGEKVLAALCELFPGSDLFTHAAALPWRGHKIHESFIASLPLGRKFPQAYLPLMPLASEKLDLTDYELIISSESGPIKGIVKRPDQRHISYCHTPMRYVWDMYEDYYNAANVFGKLSMKLFTPYMRKEDLKSADSVDTFVANSRFVADRIRRIYGRDSIVVNPPVDVDFFKGEFEKKDYYLYSGAHVHYKRLDLAEAACKRMGKKLVIVGGGKTSAADLRKAYGEAKALLFPGLEDFGIVPVEAQAAGTPVIAYGAGGALETVKEGESGLFFKEQTVDSLCEAIEEFESRMWDKEKCRRNAEKFRKETFLEKMREVIG